MILLAHRGWWKSPIEKNALVAFERAFEAGFGAETDVRDHDGALVIAHDIPRGRNLVSIEEVLALYVAYGCPGALALNIKADGLHQLLSDAVKTSGADNAFVFDMSVPDALAYLNGELSTFTRHSEVEPQPAFYDRADGVWIDCFAQDWVTRDVVLAHRAAGKRVALVSPELHRRAHQHAWRDWYGLDDDVMLCTDFPDQAYVAFEREVT